MRTGKLITLDDPAMRSKAVQRGISATQRHNLLSFDDADSLLDPKESALRFLSTRTQLYDTFFLKDGKSAGVIANYHTDWMSMPYPSNDSLKLAVVEMDSIIREVKLDIASLEAEVKRSRELRQQFTDVADPKPVKGPSDPSALRGTVQKSAKGDEYVYAGASQAALKIGTPNGDAPYIVLAARMGTAPAYANDKSWGEWLVSHFGAFRLRPDQHLSEQCKKVIMQGYLPQLHFLVWSMPVVIDCTTLSGIDYMDATSAIENCGANSRLFDCFPRQTAHGSFIDGTLVSVDITSLKDWYRRLSFYIYLDILFIRFHTGIVPPFFQRCFKNNVSVVWFTYPPHCTLYIHL